MDHPSPKATLGDSASFFLMLAVNLRTSLLIYFLFLVRYQKKKERNVCLFVDVEALKKIIPRLVRPRWGTSGASWPKEY